MCPPAARIGDMHTCPMVTPGVPPIPHVGGPISKGQPNVLVCMMPQARITDMAVCVGPPDLIVKGSAGVLVGGMPAARMGDNTAHGGVIVMGAPTVLIGESAGGGGGGGGGAAPGMPGGPGQDGTGTAGSLETEQAGLAMQNTPPGKPKYGKMTDVELQAKALQGASDSGAPFCESCEQARKDAEDRADAVRDEAREARNRRDEEKERANRKPPGYYDAYADEG